MSQFINAHWEVITLFLGMWISAIIVKAPPDLPSCPNDLYHWFIGSVQQFLNMRAAQQRPTLPAETPANPKP